jgi:hypothetical protein
MTSRKIFDHPLSPLGKRTAIALFAILAIMTFGTVVMKEMTGWRWITAFYFMAMLGTAEGPPITPPTFWSQIFAGVMAFVSIGTLITASGIIFGPALGYLFSKGRRFADEEFKRHELKKSES